MALDHHAFPDPFALAKAQIDDSTEVPGLNCEVKVYEARFNSKGERVPLQVGVERAVKPPIDKDHNSALVLTRFYKKDLEVESIDYTELEIKSPHIKKALREVIGEYPGVDLNANRVVIKNLPKCFFHYHHELTAYGSSLDDAVATQHLIFALEYMFRTLRDQLVNYYNFIESLSFNGPGLEFENLWMAYRPGDLIYVKEEGSYWAGRLKDMSRGVSMWSLKLEIIDTDGKRLGHRYEYAYIRRCENCRKLQDLRAFPLIYHSDAELIRKMLIARGARFVSLMGLHHCSFSGKATTPDDKAVERDVEDEKAISVSGRIMIDRIAFEKAYPTQSIYLDSGKLIDVENEEHLRLSDDQLCTCHYKVAGFAFSQKRWCLFNVGRVQDIVYNMEAFEFLRLPEGQKEIILSLVEGHNDGNLVFDDVIKGKGKGMVFLLYGDPGTGKTLTAESVANYTQRPLYTVNCGDFGYEPKLVEKNFLEILELAASWNAIIMIDEADVFLEQRSTRDIVRNALVSVFLRVLEYYEGILFLTTNRVSVFDIAFKSRIHLAINYTALSAASRRDLWKSFIIQGSPDLRLLWMTDAYLDRLAVEELNGRVIKNTVRTAYALANSAGESLSAEHIDTALKFMPNFDTEMASKEDEERDDRGELQRQRKRQRLE